MKQGVGNDTRQEPEREVAGDATEPTESFAASSLSPEQLSALRTTHRPSESKLGEALQTDPWRRRDTPRAIVLPVIARADRATLIMLGAPEPGKSFAVEHEETTIGRGTNVTYQIDEPSISRRHARIVRAESGRHVLHDFGSTNGTFVNGRLVRQTPLQSGDRIQLGCECVFRFAIVDKTEETFQRHLYESSMRDPLTGLANRRALVERLAAATAGAQRGGGDVGLLMMDLDHFKTVNDRFGHLAGDHVLRAIATTAGREVRSGDLLARYGGEELAVVARDVTKGDALDLAERLRCAIGGLRVDIDGNRIGVTVSVGVALLSEQATTDSEQELFARADARLYLAKLAGRDRVCA